MSTNHAPTFAPATPGTGKLVTDLSNGGGDYGRSVVLQADGKIVVAGSNYFDFAVVRYNSDGSLDTSFNGTGKLVTNMGSDTYDEGRSVAVQADGKIVVAGSRMSIVGIQDLAVVRYDSTGSLDTSFGTGGKLVTDIGSPTVDRSVAVQADGKIVVAGRDDSFGGFGSSAVVRYNSDGSLDSNFNGTGKLVIDFRSGGHENLSVAVQADGKIVVAGYSYSSPDFAVVRYNANGSLDNNFGAGGKLVIDIGDIRGDIRGGGWSVSVQADGKIVVAGQSWSSGAPDFAVVRYNNDGSLDTSFNGTGKLVTDIGSNTYDVGASVAVQADGKIVVAGESDADFAVVRYNPDGSLDTNFGSGFVPGINTLGTAVSYTENAPAIALDTSVAVFDADLAALNGGLGDYSGARVTLARSGGAAVEDVFSARGNLTFTSGNAVLSGTTVGTVSNNAGTLIITFNSNATQARVDEVLSSLGYANTSNTPPASVQIAWSFSDGNSGAQGSGAALTAMGSTTVNITAVNNGNNGETVLQPVPGGFKFVEIAGNNGAIANGLTFKLAAGTFAGDNGDSLLEAGASVTPVAGLTPVLLKTSATTARLTFEGTATDHKVADNITDLTVTFANANFINGIAPAAVTSLQVSFKDPAPAGALSLKAPETDEADTSAVYKGGTNENLPTITGTAPAGVTKVYIYDNGGIKPIGEVAVTAGTWTLDLGTLTIKNKDGAHVITASPTADGKGAMTAGFAFTTDSKAPAAPSVTAITGATSDVTPVLSGRAEKGTTVKVYHSETQNDTTLLGTTTADAKGVWTLAVEGDKLVVPAAAANKTFKITALAIDAAGNATKSPRAVDLLIDTKIDTPTLIATTAPKKNTVTLTGKVPSETSGTVQLYGGEDGTLALGGAIRIGKDGTWKSSVNLTDGKHLLSVIATDTAGNVSDNSVIDAQATVSIDTFTATPTLVLDKTGDVLRGLKGTAEAGATLKITIGSEKDRYTVTVNEDGTWTQSLAGFKPVKAGKLQITAIATDQATNVSKVSTAVAYTFTADGIVGSTDTTAPTFVSAKADAGGTKVVLTYSEELSSSTAASNTFTVKVGTDSAITPSAVAVKGNTIELTVPAITADKVVQVTYNAPPSLNTTTNNKAIQDWLVGNDAASLSLFLGTTGGDTITGTDKADIIIGDVGADIFVFTTPADSVATGFDSIMDFVSGTDVIKTGIAGGVAKLWQGFNVGGTGNLANDIAQIFSGSAALGGSDSAYVVTITGTAAGTYIFLDADGSKTVGTSELVIALTGNSSTTLTAADFIV